MADVIRIEDLPVSDDEKRVIVRALTDAAFRERLRAQAQAGELNDVQLEGVAGGAIQMNAARVKQAVLAVDSILKRVGQGAEVLCGGGSSSGGWFNCTLL